MAYVRNCLDREIIFLDILLETVHVAEKLWAANNELEVDHLCEEHLETSQLVA